MTNTNMPTDLDIIQRELEIMMEDCKANSADLDKKIAIKKARIEQLKSEEGLYTIYIKEDGRIENGQGYYLGMVVPTGNEGGILHINGQEIPVATTQEVMELVAHIKGLL